MLAIKNNLMAENAARQLGINYDNLAQSVERLSSGLRINSAKDDAAGLAVRELMRADIAVFRQGARNAQDGVSMLQTMEGALGGIDELLIRMAELAEQAATGSYSNPQREIMNQEFSEMAAEIDRIAGSTSFNGNDLLSATGTDVNIHVGTDEQIAVSAQNMTTSSSGLDIATGTAGYELISDKGAASASADWVSAVDTTPALGYTTIDIAFTGEDAISIQLDTGAGGAAQAYSLQQVADLINAETQNLGNDANGVSKNYAMASVALGDGTNGRADNVYYLTLKSRLTDTAAVTMTATASAALGATTGGIVSSGVDVDDVTEAIDEGTADQGLFGKQASTGLSIDTAANALTALTAITDAITAKDTARASFGYKMNRLESTISILNIQSENLMVAESRISDVDVATEMATMTRTQVLVQAGIAMLAQANAMPQMALSLLR